MNETYKLSLNHVDNKIHISATLICMIISYAM